MTEDSRQARKYDAAELFHALTGVYIDGVPRKKSKQGKHVIATSGSDIGIFSIRKAERPSRP